MEYENHTKWGIRNNVSWSFFANLDKMKNNTEVAKWGVQSNATERFYITFNESIENIELAKWSVNC